MINQYPLWKYVLVVAVLFFGALYALPNLFGEDPSLQISASSGQPLDEETLVGVQESLSASGIEYKSVDQIEGRTLIRFGGTEVQLEAMDRIKDRLGPGYVVALNLAPATPDWLRSLSAAPMYLGLDLRGGVHFLMEVDMDAAVKQAAERFADEIRGVLRTEKIRYVTIDALDSGVRVKFRDAATRDRALGIVSNQIRDLEYDEADEGSNHFLQGSMREAIQREVRQAAVDQNITTLRNRVNELGVAEPVIQKQGSERIVVQLPGVQDTARAKEILGATATLEFRLVDVDHDPRDAVGGRVPVGSKLYYERAGDPVLLKKRVIVTGDQIINASYGLEQQSGTPAVFVTLDGNGARRMSKVSRDNIGRPMAVVFIENKTDTKLVDGERVTNSRRVEEVINVATIRDHLSKRFQISGLDSPAEAQTLALLLRAGALAAPIHIVEERTVGPSLGQDNIDQGFRSVLIGFVAVLIFMAVYYRVFGLVADVALALNLVLIVALLSALQATLTLPGIAGIVLTVGMAVDANVLIFERIREEVRNGNSPQASIHSGYEKAFSTILDANITTLIAAVVLFSFGTGPIKGFAVTLSLGIITSMFTAIIGTRSLINLIYGGRRVARLAI